jgi:glycosyltransferase involved in cell wall biosynthesis
MSNQLDLNIVVQGRFHAFALARELLAKGVKLKVLTNYPRFIARRFGLPEEHLQGFGTLGFIHRYACRWTLLNGRPWLDALVHQGFSKWASHQIAKNPPRVVHAFSGVALDIYRPLAEAGSPVVKMLTRGSGHICSQFRDLRSEWKRAGTPIDIPTPWMIKREKEEYLVADKIVTLSSFARNSFLARGYAEDKVLLLSLGSNVKQFRPDRSVIDARLARLRSGERLTVVYAGNVSLQKGVIDLIEVAKELHGRIKFRIVGNVTEDAAARIEAARPYLELVPRVPEDELPGIYDAADLFMFPTLHDGFAAVLAQAKAACLPIVSTDHCAAPDLLNPGEHGWIVPVRRPDCFVARLRELDAQREQTAQMVENLWSSPSTRDWSDVADDFIKLMDLSLSEKTGRGMSC